MKYTLYNLQQGASKVADTADLTKARNPYANMIGLVPGEQGEGTAECTLEVRDDHHHSGGVVHGGIAYGMADTCMAMALMPTFGPGEFSATIECKMSYLAPVTSGTLRCKATILRRGKRVAFLEAEVHEGSRLIATATASFAIIDLKNKPANKGP